MSEAEAHYDNFDKSELHKHGGNRTLNDDPSERGLAVKQSNSFDIDWLNDPRLTNEKVSIGEAVPKLSVLAAVRRQERLDRWKRSSKRGDSFRQQNDIDGTMEDQKPLETYEEMNPHMGMDSVGFLKDMLFGKPINVLLLFLPLAKISHDFAWSSQLIFWFNFLAMVPLASILGDFTEALAAHTNETVGGLINATFGNAVEVVVAVQALLQNEIRVVQASMIGSIFSNLLLVLGCCFFFGGMKFKEQTFNTTATTANMSLLSLSSLALVLPTPFAEYYNDGDVTVLEISRAASVFLMAMYIQMLFFQLKTHAHLLEGAEEETPEVAFSVALVGLIFVTVLIASLSDYLVESIDGFVEESGISRTFVGLVILPIVGNAVEHITAISVAMKDKMDLAMGVAVGSSVQIAMFVVPLIVMVGWATGRNMTLNFPHFEIALYVISLVIVQICLSNGRGNWLLGSLLVTTYVMIAVGFWFEVVEDFR